MPIRNPFTRRPGVITSTDENARPDSASGDVAHPGFERVDTMGSKASSALSIRSGRSMDTGEYKMSVVNDSGVYLPPSPVEKEASWPRRYLARSSTDTRSDVGEIEHFSISRESFDSYRRSFDISARSPVVTSDPAPRQSLDSARFPRHPRSSLRDRRFGREPPTAEEWFEDVGLNDEQKAAAQQAQQQHQLPVKKRGFFSKFGSEHPAAEPQAQTPPGTNNQGSSSSAQTTVSRFLISGRKRGQSGQGAELGQIERPKTAGSVVEAQEISGVQT